ncbi:MAG: ABC transporter permease [Alphaproteobacteria bacterium BRH_c36]|nr:MAG: ABC transporter permease [Alphaproteobacteria bacterium BRH_c36]
MSLGATSTNAASNKSIPGQQVGEDWLYRAQRALTTPMPYLGIAGIAMFILFWYLTTEYFKLPRFVKLPGPVEVWTEFTNPDPIYGTSMYTFDYYKHIAWSSLRVMLAFALATGLGVPLGLYMGWKKKFKDYVFPIIEVLRPIPVLAWVPLAILMMPGREAPIIFLAFLAAFFATTLNAMLGVESIDESYFRASQCLGSTPWNVFKRVVVPGALPDIFTGLQIGVGVAWFSLVAAEMVSGEHGLGFLIWDSYVLSQYPVIVIAMVTLGLVGYVYSLLIRIVGRSLMRWTQKGQA